MSSTLRIMPPSYARPTTLDRKLLVTLWVMSTRCGSPPFGDQNALVDDDAGQLTTILDRTDGIAERLSTEGSVVVKLEIARVLDLARDGEVDRVFQQLRVDTCLPRRLALPVRAWEHLRLCRQGRRHQCANDNRPEPDLHRALFPVKWRNDSTAPVRRIVERSWPNPAPFGLLQKLNALCGANFPPRARSPRGPVRASRNYRPAQ